NVNGVNLDTSDTDYRIGAPTSTGQVLINYNKYFKANDVISIKSSHGWSAGGNNSGENLTIICKSSNSNSISVNETVAFSYSDTSGQPIPNTEAQPLTWNIKRVNTHGGSFNGTSYFIPLSGIYMISAQVRFSNNTSGFRELQLRVNGEAIVDHPTEIAAGSNTYSGYTVCRISGITLDLKKGDQVYLIAYQNSGTTITIFNAAQNNFFSITKI
ncbi:MAG: hypothetical protein AAF518_27495, partial [Spirochaetota bacterium]